MTLSTQATIQFKLPALPYAFEALEPHIDSETMKIHHGKHHAGYVQKLNAAMEKEGIEEEGLDKILKRVSKYSEAVRNNAGGHYNHSLFWTILSPEGGKMTSGKLPEAINENFGSFDEFKSRFEDAAKSRFGSGWAWLIVQDNKLVITSTPNQDNPLMDVAETRGIPILGLDVWEHAYYLKYQNKRPEYVSAFWNIVNWDEVGERFEAAVNDSL